MFNLFYQGMIDMEKQYMFNTRNSSLGTSVHLWNYHQYRGCKHPPPPQIPSHSFYCYYFLVRTLTILSILLEKFK